MSKQIDLSKPLSDFDRQYLVDRGRYDLIAIADDTERDAVAEKLADEAPDAPSTDSARAQQQREPQTAPGGDNPRPLSAGGQEQHDAGSGEEEEGDNYDDKDVWSYAELQSEIKDRNEESDRAEEDKMSAAGSREELIERLRADDVKNEADEADGADGSSE